MSDHGDTEVRSLAATSTRASTPASLVSMPLVRPRGSYRQQIPDHLTAATKIRPPTSRYLDTQHFSVQENGFYFQSKAEAELSMNEAQWHSPAHDASMPQTDAEDRRIVGQLLSAAKNMSRAKDTQASAYRKKTCGYPDWAMEACAWDVLFIAKSIHTDGFRAPLYDAPLMDAIGETRFWTFQDRIDWICEALMTSKNVVVNLMKKEKLLTIVGAPQKLYTATIVNTRSNACRGVWVKNGREADEEHQGRFHAKRAQVDDIPISLPKRQKMDITSSEDASFAASSQAPDPVAGNNGPKATDTNLPYRTNKPSDLYFPYCSYKPTTAIPAPPPAKGPETGDVAMTDAPNPPLTSFVLGALNDMVKKGTKKPSSETLQEVPATTQNGKDDRSAHLAERADCNAVNGKEKMSSSSRMAPRPVEIQMGDATEPVDAVHPHQAAEIDAAHVLASLQQSSSP